MDREKIILSQNDIKKIKKEVVLSTEPPRVVGFSIAGHIYRAKKVKVFLYVGCSAYLEQISILQKLSPSTRGTLVLPVHM